MKFRPLHDRILVERVGEEEKTKTGIIIPDSAREKQQRGKVIAVGKGRVNDKGEVIKLDVKEGDVVLFEKVWWRGHHHRRQRVCDPERRRRGWSH